MKLFLYFVNLFFFQERVKSIFYQNISFVFRVNIILAVGYLVSTLKNVLTTLAFRVFDSKKLKKQK